MTFDLPEGYIEDTNNDQLFGPIWKALLGNIIKDDIQKERIS